jgi:glycosyltransferase involved in cell wall biosynthesis
LLDLIARVDRGEFEPVLGVPDPGPLAERAEALGVPVERMPMPRLRRRRLTRIGRAVTQALETDALTKAMRLLRPIVGLRRAIGRIGPALVHANSSRALACAGAAALRRPPVIWHARDLAPLGAVGRLLLHRARHVIAVSRAVAKSLARYGDPARVTVIHNGIDGDWISPERITGERVRSELGLATGQPLIGMVGQLVPWKRHDLFLEAAARIAQALPEARFAIAGGDLFGHHPGYSKELEARAKRLGLAERTRFLGHRADALEVIAALDVMLHPSECEPFGRVILEAMALGKPVVAADAAGPAEIIEHSVSGLLAPPGDIDKMAAAVVGLVQRPRERARIGAAARERAIGQFPIARTVSQVETIYREVTRGS